MKMKQLAVDLPPSLHYRLRRYAAEKGVSYSSVVEAAVEHYLDRQLLPAGQKRPTWSSLVEAALTCYLDEVDAAPLREIEWVAGEWRTTNALSTLARAILGPPSSLEELLAGRVPPKLPN